MRLRSTSRRLFPELTQPTTDPITFSFPDSDENMATELTNIAQRIANLTIPTPPMITSTTELINKFIPKFKEMLLGLSPARNYLNLFFPLSTWTQADIDRNILLCNIPDPGAYPVYDLAGGMDANLYHAAESRFKRDSSKHADCLCAHYVVHQFLLRAIPPTLAPIIFLGDLDFAINLDPTAIYNAIRTHFATPTRTEFLALETALSQPFTYVDSTSLDTYLSKFQISASTLAIIGAALPPAQLVHQLSKNLRACPDADVFMFALQMYEQTHAAINSVTLPSFLQTLLPVGAALIIKHAATTTTPLYSINAAVKDRHGKPRAPRDFNGYCWSCGNKNHPSDKCNKPKEGHQPTCTWQNRKEFPGFCVPPTYGQRDKNTKA